MTLRSWASKRSPSDGAKTWLALRPISARLSAKLAALGERLVDRDVAGLAILDEEDDVGDMVEELDRRKRPPEDRGKRRRGIVLGPERLRDFAHFQAAACLFIKSGR